MPSERSRVEFRTDPSWLAEVRAAADRLSLSLSGFIRMTVSQAMERRRDPLPAASAVTAAPLDTRLQA
ncbi:MAG: hypothetical protein JNM56_27255 [Planctomycetia bacterium]|nr:hypothetical protein [Planctomycetia bacterium]